MESFLNIESELPASRKRQHQTSLPQLDALLHIAPERKRQKMATPMKPASPKEIESILNQLKPTTSAEKYSVMYYLAIINRLSETYCRTSYILLEKLKKKMRVQESYREYWSCKAKMYLRLSRSVQCRFYCTQTTFTIVDFYCKYVQRQKYSHCYASFTSYASSSCGT